MEPEHIMVDKGYRGHKYLGKGLVHIAGRIPMRVTRSFRKMMKRRSAIEPTIGHLKSDHRLERNFLWGIPGDRLNALLFAIGNNFCILLRALACLVFFQFRVAWETVQRWFAWFENRIWHFVQPLIVRA
ncbi:MAG: hypothetical protein DWI28_02750 [Planctomycetota bacterium]|nr:MAG: hypothetical protein DWI28_02750 [Planctomycetota bacterium]